MSLNKKNIESIFKITLLFFAVSVPSYSYENFDECGLLISKIKKNFHKLSLDEPSISYQSSYFLKKQVKGYALKNNKNKNINQIVDSIPLARTKNNHIIIESVNPYHELRDEYLKPNAIIYAMNGKQTSKMNDKEVYDEYIKSEKFTIIDPKDNKKYTYDEKGEGQVESKTIWVHVQPKTISNIDTLSGTFISSYIFNLHWYNDKINTLADEVYNEALLKDKEVKDYNFYCSFDHDQLNGIYLPNLIFKNKVQDFENISTKYILEYTPKYEDEESFTTITKSVSASSQFQVDFDFKSFPFDKQYLKFEIENNDLFNPVVLDWSWNMPEQIQDFYSLRLLEWKKTDIDINYQEVTNILHGISHDSLEIIFIIERYFDYFLFKIILPIFLILILAWSTFWISAREIESRLTVSVVCFLSLVAYTFVIDESIPKLSYLTVMDVIVLLAYIFSAIPTFQSIKSFRLLKNNNEQNSMDFDKKYQKIIPITFIISVIFIFAIFSGDNMHTISALTF